MPPSPSEIHRYLMSQLVPSLGYDGGDVRRCQKGIKLQRTRA